MEIGDWKATSELSKIFREARDLGLESNLAELEAFGFTIVEPDKAANPGFADRLREATLAVYEQEESSAVHYNKRADKPAAGRQLYHLVNKPAQNPIFIEALLNPVVLTLARYLMGDSCRLSSTVGHVKYGTANPTVMHTDSIGVPPPLPPFSAVCNISWLLTPFTEETGTFYIVPGSHRYCRHPGPGDLPQLMGGPADDALGIPVVAKPGSILAFQGNTWHGTYFKRDSDVRVHVANFFCRNYVNPMESYDDISDEVVGRCGEDFARLIGREAWQGYKGEGPRYERIRAVHRANLTPSA